MFFSQTDYPAGIGAMWDRTCYRVDHFVTNNKVDVGSICGEGVIIRKVKFWTSLPPPMHDSNYPLRYK